MACRDTPASRQFEICDNLGVDYVWPMLFTDAAGAAINITSDTIKLTVRDTETNALELELTTTAGTIVVTNGEGGAAEARFTNAAKTAATITAGTYDFSVILTHDGSPQVTHGGVYDLGADANGESP